MLRVNTGSRLHWTLHLSRRNMRRNFAGTFTLDDLAAIGGRPAGYLARPVDGFRWDKAPLDRNEPGPWLVPVGEYWELYEPERARTLLSEWRLLCRHPTDANVRGFAKRFGWLGDGRDVTTPGGEHLFGESYSSWLRARLTFNEIDRQWRAAVTLAQEPRDLRRRAIAADQRRKKAAREGLATD